MIKKRYNLGFQNLAKLAPMKTDRIVCVFLLLSMSFYAFGEEFERSELEEIKKSINENAEKLDYLLTNSKETAEEPALQQRQHKNHYGVTPRLALRASNFQTYGENIYSQSTVEQLVYKTIGMSFHYIDRDLPKYNFIVSVLYGSDQTRVNNYIGVDLPTGQKLVAPLRFTRDTELWDIELAARSRINNTNANFIAGIQTVQFFFDDESEEIIPTLNGKQEIKFHAKLYLVKIGIGGYSFISEDKRHRIFSNLLVGGGFTQTRVKDNWRTLVSDVNFGYEWIMRKSTAISVRYRGQFAYQSDINSDLTGMSDGFFVLHGPEFNFAYRF